MTVATGSRVSIRRAQLQDRPRAYEWLVRSDLTPQLYGPLFPEREVPTPEQFEWISISMQVLIPSRSWSIAEVGGVDAS